MSKSCLIFGLLLILVSFSSCRPRKVLSRSEMVDMLFDIHLTKALVDNNYGSVPAQWKRGLSDKDFKDMAYQSVLRKHDVTEETFYTSVSYYSKHLRLYTKIYIAVDQRMQDYIKEMQVFHYTVPSFRECLAHITLDTLKVHSLYHLGSFKADTIPEKSFVPRVGKALPYGAWFARQYMSELKKGKSSFSMIPQIDKDDKLVKSMADSVDVKVDTIGNNQNKPVAVPSKKEIVDISRKVNPNNVRKAIIMDQQRLRLEDRLHQKKDAGK